MAYPQGQTKRKAQAESPEFKALKEQVKTCALKKVYLFSGEEKFLSDHYVRELKRLILSGDFSDLNLIVFEGKTSANGIIDACETFPVFAEKKLVLVKNTGLLSLKKKSGQEAGEDKSGSDDGDEDPQPVEEESAKGSKDQELLKNYLPDLPDTTCLVWLEDAVDKRTGLYKAITKYGLHVQFEHLDPEGLVNWVARGFHQNGKAVSVEAAEYLVGISEPDMYFLKNEILKITRYTGDRKQVEISDIRAVATVTIKSVIFDLMDAFCNKDRARALSYLDDMLELKEPEQKILSMIAKQTGDILKMKKFLSMRLPSGDTAKYFPKKHPFVLRKLTEQAGRLDAAYLQNLLAACMEADSSYKKGRISPRLALEVLFNKI